MGSDRHVPAWQRPVNEPRNLICCHRAAKIVALTEQAALLDKRLDLLPSFDALRNHIDLQTFCAVSYTHLTLPTIYSV